MSTKLYELAGQGDAKISPHCWKSVYAVCHKGLDLERIGISFFEKDRIAFSGQMLVPVLEDGENVIADSWAGRRIPGRGIPGSAVIVRRGDRQGRDEVYQ